MSREHLCLRCRCFKRHPSIWKALCSHLHISLINNFFLIFSVFQMSLMIDHFVQFQRKKEKEKFLKEKGRWGEKELQGELNFATHTAGCKKHSAASRRRGEWSMVSSFPQAPPAQGPCQSFSKGSSGRWMGDIYPHPASPVPGISPPAPRVTASFSFSGSDVGSFP